MLCSFLTIQGSCILRYEQFLKGDLATESIYQHPQAFILFAGFFCFGGRLLKYFKYLFSYIVEKIKKAPECKLIILVNLGCHNKIPQTEWLKQLKFAFSQLMSLESPRSRSSRIQFLVRALFLVFRWLPYCVLTCRRHTQRSSSSYKATV